MLPCRELRPNPASIASIANTGAQSAASNGRRAQRPRTLERGSSTSEAVAAALRVSTSDET